MTNKTMTILILAVLSLFIIGCAILVMSIGK